jgi:hypothetical protein
MATQWLVWALAALLLGFAVTCAAFVLAAARGAERRDLDLSGPNQALQQTAGAGSLSQVL